MTGVGASLLSLSWDPMRVSAGASGAIFGIAGALITVLYFGKLGLQPESVRKLLGYVVRFAFLNLLFGLQGHIDNMAHLGGLVSGLLIGTLPGPDLQPCSRGTAGAPQHRSSQSALSCLCCFLFLLPKPSNTLSSLAKARLLLTMTISIQPSLIYKSMLPLVPTMPLDTLCWVPRCSRHERFDEAVPEFERALAIDRIIHMLKSICQDLRLPEKNRQSSGVVQKRHASAAPNLMLLLFTCTQLRLRMPASWLKRKATSARPFNLIKRTSMRTDCWQKY